MSKKVHALLRFMELHCMIFTCMITMCKYFLLLKPLDDKTQQPS